MAYLKPNFVTAKVFNRIALMTGLSGTQPLTVIGRKTGKPHTVPVIPVEENGASISSPLEVKLSGFAIFGGPAPAHSAPPAPSDGSKRLKFGLRSANPSSPAIEPRPGAR